MIAIDTDRLGKRDGERRALRDCTLSVPEGRIVGLVGANGAGKTTLLHLTVGLLTPTAGTITVLGAQPAAMRVTELVQRLQELPGECEVIVAVPTDTYEQLYVTPYPVVGSDVELDDEARPSRAVIMASSHIASATTIGVWYRCVECGCRQYVTEGTPPPWCARCDSYYLVP